MAGSLAAIRSWDPLPMSSWKRAVDERSSGKRQWSLGRRIWSGRIGVVPDTAHPIDVLKGEDWMAEVDNVAGLATAHSQREGQQHDFRPVHLVSVTVEDGRDRISRIESFNRDQAAVDRFFSVEP